MSNVIKNELALKRVVEDILSKNMQARNDDATLLYEVCKRYSKLTPDLKFFQQIPNLESVLRNKREIQGKEGKYLSLLQEEFEKDD